MYDNLPPLGGQGGRLKHLRLSAPACDPQCYETFGDVAGYCPPLAGDQGGGKRGVEYESR